jgi:hypothetical protein
VDGVVVRELIVASEVSRWVRGIVGNVPNHWVLRGRKGLRGTADGVRSRRCALLTDLYRKKDDPRAADFVRELSRLSGPVVPPQLSEAILRFVPDR